MSNDTTTQPRMATRSSKRQTTTGQAQPEPVQEESGSFVHIISDIMRGFGDCEKPLRESVEMVEKILREELQGILHEALDVAYRRKGVPEPTTCDFEMLMRNKPLKILRMRKHMRDMRLLRRILQMQPGRKQGPLDDQDSGNESDREIEAKHDEEKTRRLFRADRISQVLSEEDYAEFNEARRTSFYCRHGEKMKVKFRSFLGIPPELRLPNVCLSILAYLAHETIATIVDYAILTRLDSSNRCTDPFARLTSSITSSAMYHLCPEVTQGRGSEPINPITLQEIVEGVRRHTFMNNKSTGFHRNVVDYKKTFLAF